MPALGWLGRRRRKATPSESLQLDEAAARSWDLVWCYRHCREPEKILVPVVPAGSDAMCETEAYHGAKARHSVGDQARTAPSRLYEEQTLWGLFSLSCAAAGRLSTTEVPL